MLTKDQDGKKINYMGLSELMRMIIISVTYCLNKKKKIPKKQTNRKKKKKPQERQLALP